MTKAPKAKGRPKDPRAADRTQINVKISRTVKEDLDMIAEIERRTLADQADILLEKAIAIWKQENADRM